jgi:hypothetical protein
MNTTARFAVGVRGLLLTLCLTAVGCAAEPAEPPEAPPKPPEKPAVEAKKVQVGRNVWLEIQGDRRRVLLAASVCLRQGQLEQLLCRKHTKEHEAILTADLDARDIHTALLAAGAKPGTPVRYEPKFQAPSGSRIKVSLQYQDKGKLVTVPAQRWVREMTTRKDLAYDWVFAGSVLVPDPDNKDRPPFYAANSGDVICVSNFESAMLDLPINSPKDNSELAFEAHTERIPPLDTKVTVILEAVADPKK